MALLKKKKKVTKILLKREVGILERWQSRKDQESVSPLMQQLHRQNLSCGIVPVPPEEKTGMEALLAHQQGHSQQNFPLTLKSQWHIQGHMLLTLVLRDLHFCGRKHTEQLGQESRGKQQCFIHFCLVSHKLLLIHFLHLQSGDLIPSLSL